MVAKAWLLALVADAPLAQAGLVPAGELARGGPALCSGVLVALASDAELERLVVGEGRAPLGASAARLTGARTPAALAAGIEALRAVTWRALRAELRDPVPELVADLADRLAYVCARIVQASLAAPSADVPRGAGPLADALATEERPSAVPGAGDPGRRASIRAFMPVPAEPTPADAGRPAAAPSEPSHADPSDDPGDAHEVAQHAAALSSRWTPPPAEPEHTEPLAAPPNGVQPVDLPAAPATVDPLTSLAEELATAPPSGLTGALPASAYAPARDAPTVTRLRQVDTSWEDAVEHGPPWLAAISHQLERRKQDALPFAVFVVEVDDLDRLLAAQTGREVAVALETAERDLTSELTPTDLVVRERLGRWWLTSSDRDAHGARDLGTRVSAAIGRTHLGGAPLAVSVGLAVCPDDGETVDALAGHADESMFAARAAGVPLA